jgi:hypothetical protein
MERNARKDRKARTLFAGVAGVAFIVVAILCGGDGRAFQYFAGEGEVGFRAA